VGLTLSFITGAVGSGWLTIPKAYSIYGLIPGVSLFCLSVLNIVIAIKLLADLMCTYKNLDFYSEIVEAVLGKRWKSFHSSTYLLNLFGSCIA